MGVSEPPGDVSYVCVCVCVCVWAGDEAATVLIDKQKTRFQNVNCRKARQ